MMNFGPIKLLFTAVMALLILGPKRIPGAVRSLGKALGELKRASAQVSEELKASLDAEGAGGAGGTDAKPHIAPPPPEELRPGPR
jgi:Sec-independent protein translocase protein TatA